MTQVRRRVSDSHGEDGPTAGSSQVHHSGDGRVADGVRIWLDGLAAPAQEGPRQRILGTQTLAKGEVSPVCQTFPASVDMLKAKPHKPLT